MLLKCNVNNSAVCVCVVPEAIEMSAIFFQMMGYLSFQMMRVF